jgi:hypothetical protein
MLDHGPCDLMFAHDGDASAEFLQMIDLGIGVGAGDDRQTSVDGAGLLDDLAGLKSIGNGNEAPASPR